MSITQVLSESLESLNGNKLRSGLTILGITNAINSMGTNVLFVFAGSRGNRSGPTVRNIRQLTMEDANALTDSVNAPSIAAAAPVLQGNADVAAEGTTSSTTVYGVTPIYAQIRNQQVSEGSFITEEQLNGRKSVAVIGPDLADTIFGKHDGLVGTGIRIAGQPFTIIGVLESKGGSSMGSSDDQIIIPLTTARSRVIHRSGSYVDTIYVQAASADASSSAQEQITTILEARHRIKNGADDFTVFSQQDMLETSSSISGVLTAFLGGIAGISLLVGGIGIMNIMLVSVAERTREIGLRKALGARKRDILVQFLAESLMLSLMGGLIGVLFGWAISRVIGSAATAMGNSLSPVVSLASVLLATLFSAAIGLFFGSYPANRAAGLQPVEALRYE
jgi:putative ABC transport system permease protein